MSRCIGKGAQRLHVCGDIRQFILNVAYFIKSIVLGHSDGTARHNLHGGDFVTDDGGTEIFTSHPPVK